MEHDQSFFNGVLSASLPSDCFQIALIPAITPNNRIKPNIPGFFPPGPDPACSAPDKIKKRNITPTVAKIFDVLLIF